MPCRVLGKLLSGLHGVALLTSADSMQNSKWSTLTNGTGPETNREGVTGSDITRCRQA